MSHHVEQHRGQDQLQGVAGGEEGGGRQEAEEGDKRQETRCRGHDVGDR